MLNRQSELIHPPISGNGERPLKILIHIDVAHERIRYEISRCGEG